MKRKRLRWTLMRKWQLIPTVASLHRFSGNSSASFSSSSEKRLPVMRIYGSEDTSVSPTRTHVNASRRSFSSHKLSVPRCLRIESISAVESEQRSWSILVPINRSGSLIAGQKTPVGGKRVEPRSSIRENFLSQTFYPHGIRAKVERGANNFMGN